MRAQRERQFTAMMNLVLEHVPDDPAARMWGGCLPFLITHRRGRREALVEIGGGPASPRVGVLLPGHLEARDERGGFERPLIDPIGGVPMGDGRQPGVTFTHPYLKPPHPVGDDVLRHHADRPMPRRRGQVELRAAQRREAARQPLLVACPACVESRQREGRVRHRRCVTHFP